MHAVRETSSKTHFSNVCLMYLSKHHFSVEQHLHQQNFFRSHPSQKNTMQPHREDDIADCCQICGATGWKETLLTCCKCNLSREHAYCLKYPIFKIPNYWVCDPCKSMSVSTSPRKVNQGVSSRASEMHQTGKTAIVKSLSEDEVIRLSSGRPSCTLPTIRKASVGSKNDSSSVSSLIPNSNPRDSSTKVLGKHPRNDEIHNKPMTSKHASCSLSSKGPTKECTGENQQPLGGVIIDKNVQIHYPGKEQPTNRASFEALSTRKSFTFVGSGPPKKCSRKNQRPMGGVIPGKKIQTHDPHEEKPTKGGPFEALSASKSSSIVGSGGIPCADVECNLSNGEKNDLSIQQNLNFDRKSLPSSIPTWRGKFQILQTAAPSKFYDGFEAQPPFVVNAKAYKFSTEMPSVLQLESRPALNVLTDIFLDDSPNLQDIALYFFPSQQTERSRENLISILTFMNAEKSMLRSYINGVELLIFTPYQLDMNSRGVITAVNAGHFLWGFFRKKKIDKRVVRVPDKEPDMGIDMVGGRDMMERADHVRLVTPKLVSDNDLDVPPGFEKLPKFHK